MVCGFPLRSCKLRSTNGYVYIVTVVSSSAPYDVRCLDPLFQKSQKRLISFCWWDGIHEGYNSKKLYGKMALLFTESIVVPRYWLHKLSIWYVSDQTRYFEQSPFVWHNEEYLRRCLIRLNPTSLTVRQCWEIASNLLHQIGWN